MGCLCCSQVTKEEYARVGSEKLGEQLEQQLKAEGRKPYIVPVGGSGAIGTFGYLAASQEILEQAGKGAFTDIVNVGSLLIAGCCATLARTLPFSLGRLTCLAQLPEDMYAIAFAG